MSFPYEATYCVYCHTSPSGKRYVGITCKKPEQRWRKGNGYKGYPFFRAIEKYGWDNIKHEILEDELSKEQAIAKEIYYVALYRSNDPDLGYNVTAGGEGTNGAPRSEKTKKILSEKCRGFKHSPEAIEKIRAKAKENWTRPEFRQRMLETHSGPNHHAYGKPVPLERRIKQSESMKGHKFSEEYKRQASIRMTGKGNPNFGRKFDEKFCELQRQKGLLRMSDPNQRQHLRDCFERKIVAQYDLDGNHISTYDGLHEAERNTGIRASNISLCCRSKRKSAGGYVWRYAEGDNSNCC